MNWRRGFLRLWMVATAVWLASSIFLFRIPATVAEYQKGLPSADEVLGPKDDAWNALLYEAKHPAISWHRDEAQVNLRRFLIFGFGAPICAFALGCAVDWIARGFRSRSG